MYAQIDFWRFAIALAVVAVPAFLLERSDDDTWAWRYAVLILLMMVIANWQATVTFARFLQRAARGG